mgnify:FL=1
MNSMKKAYTIDQQIARLKSNGMTFDDEEKAKEILEEDEIYINIDLHQGEASAKAWGCDLTYDYVKINGDYRS